MRFNKNDIYISFSLKNPLEPSECISTLYEPFISSVKTEKNTSEAQWLIDRELDVVSKGR